MTAAVAAARAPRARRTRAPAPDFLRLEDQLCFPIYLASRLVVGAYRPLLAKTGITYPQYLVLLVLWAEDGLSVAAIGERLHLDSGTLTPMLKRMARQGLVTRRRQADDDRVVENWLTEEARAMKKRVARVPVELLCAAKLNIAQVGEIKEMLRSLIDRLLPLQEREVEEKGGVAASLAPRRTRRVRAA